MIRLSIPYIKQRERSYCGPACAEMAARYHGADLPQEAIANTIAPQGLPDEGSDGFQLSKALRQFGFQAKYQHIKSLHHLETILRENKVILALAESAYYETLHWYALTGLSEKEIYVRDPFDARRQKFPSRQFRKSWMLADEGYGVIVGPPRD